MERIKEDKMRKTRKLKYGKFILKVGRKHTEGKTSEKIEKKLRKGI